MRTFGAKPCSRRCASSVCWIADRAGDRVVLRVEADEEAVAGRDHLVAVVLREEPRSVSSCQPSSVSQASSPSTSARFVEPTMSVNRNVFCTLRAPPSGRGCWIGSSSPTSSIRIARVGHENAAARSTSSSTLSTSTTIAFAKSPDSQSNAVGAIAMQLPAPMQRGRSTERAGPSGPRPRRSARGRSPQIARSPRSGRTSRRGPGRRIRV